MAKRSRAPNSPRTSQSKLAKPLTATFEDGRFAATNGSDERDDGGESEGGSEDEPLHAEDESASDIDLEEEEQEEESEAGAAAEAAAEAAAVAAKRARHGGGDDRYALPTPEEANQLRQTEDLFRGNLLRLEAAELLAEVRVDHGAKACRKLDTWLFKLRDALVALPSTPSITEGSIGLPGIVLPSRAFNPTGARAASLDFAPPANVALVGSYMLHSLTRPALCVDIAVEMPAACLQARDALNNRYFDKRALYLGQLARHALGAISSSEAGDQNGGEKGGGAKRRSKKSRVGEKTANGASEVSLAALVASLEVSYFRGDARKPVLLLQPRLDGSGPAGSGGKAASAGASLGQSSRFVVRLLPVAPEGFFPADKLAPTRNNVRRRNPRQEDFDGAAAAAPLAAEGLPDPLLAGSGSGSGSGSGGGGGGGGGSSGRWGLEASANAPGEPCTPHYNSAVLEDMAMKRHLAALHEALGEGDALRDALLLGKVWLTQRGQRTAYDGICSHGLAMLLLHLLQRRVVSPRMAPLQALAALLSFVAGGGLTAGCMLVRTVGDKTAAAGQLTASGEAAYRRAFAASLIDTSDGLNVLHRVSLEALQELRADAAAAVSALAARGPDTIAALFLQRAGFWRKHDCFVRVPLLTGGGGGSSAAGGGAADPLLLAMVDEEEEDALCDVPLWRHVARRACSLLRRALGDRCRGCRCLLGVSGEDPADFRGAAGSVSWALSAAAPAAGYAPGAWLCIGLALEPMNAGRLVDRGPPADDEAAAAAFRRFWGGRSQLRRFKDGAIVEAVVWGGSSGGGGNGDGGAAGRQSIVRDICLHVLAIHDAARCAPPSSSGREGRGGKAGGNGGARFCGDELLQAIAARRDPATGDASGGKGSGGGRSAAAGKAENGKAVDSAAAAGLLLPAEDDALTRACLRAFDEVAAAAKDVKGMPLRVDTVQAVSPLLRYTAPVPPAPHPLCISPAAAEPPAGAAAAASRGRSTAAAAAAAAAAVPMAPGAAAAPFWDSRASRGARITSQVAAVDCLLRLESSGKWPDELAAIRRTAAALLIRLAQCLERDAGLRCFVTRQESNGAAALEVMAGGYCFRVRIAADVELAALRAKAAAAGVASVVGGPPAAAAALAAGNSAAAGAANGAAAADAVLALAAASGPAQQGAEARALQVLLEAAPRHHSAIHGVHLRHPAFGPTVRAAARWVAAHLFAWHLPHEALELVVASLFESGAAAPLPPPATPLSGLLRFLLLLAGHDWARTPLAVDLNGELTAEDRQAVQRVFEAARAGSGSGGGGSGGNGGGGGGAGGTAGPAMYVVAPYDRAWGWRPSWTSEHRPEAVVLTRAAALASRSAAQLVQWAMGDRRGGGGGGGGSWRRIFAASAAEVDGFDALLRVHPALCYSHGAAAGAADGADAFLALRIRGCRAMRLKLYKNLLGGGAGGSGPRGGGGSSGGGSGSGSGSGAEEAASRLLVDLEPVVELVGRLRARFGHLALFFYSDWAPDAIAIVWRPAAMQPATFSVVHSRHAAPAPVAEGKAGQVAAGGGTAVVTNLADVLSEMRALAGDLLIA